MMMKYYENEQVQDTETKSNTKTGITVGNETVKFEDLTEVEQEQFNPLLVQLATHLYPLLDGEIVSVERPDVPMWGTVQGFVDVMERCQSKRIALAILDELSEVRGTDNPYTNLWKSLVTVVHWETMEPEVKNRHLRLVK
jgi:hypothetical protein